jgi:hypothetical protein
MKKISTILSILCIAIACVALSCSKDKKEQEPASVKTPITLEINGENIVFNAAAAKMPTLNGNNEYYYLWLDYYSANSFLRKLLVVQLLKPELGYKQLHKFDNFSSLRLVSDFTTYLSDGDVVGNSYHLNEADSIPDYLEITKFDTLAGVLHGSLQASYFVRPDEHFDLSSPDTLVVKSVNFEMKIAK